MVTCDGCGGSYAPRELVRHQLGRLLVVHCPSCNSVLGQYRPHGDDPRTDTAKQP